MVGKSTEVVLPKKFTVEINPFSEADMLLLVPLKKEHGQNFGKESRQVGQEITVAGV